MTPDDIRDVLRFRGAHGMARVAKDPDSEISHWKQSMAGYYGREGRIDTKPDGIHVTDQRGYRVITWKAIKAHALKHTPADVRALIFDIDWEWCRAKTGTPGHPPARAVTCERWLEHLARSVWDPALGIPDTPEPEQLDLFSSLEGAA